MVMRYSKATAKVVMKSRRLARDCGHPVVEVSHLIWAIALRRNSLSARALADVELSADVVRDRIIHANGYGEWQLGQPFLDKEAHDACVAAMRWSRHMDSDLVRPPQLLTALVASPPGRVFVGDAVALRLRDAVKNRLDGARTAKLLLVVQ